MPVTLTRDQIVQLSSDLDADVEILDDRPTVRDHVTLANGVLVALLATDIFAGGVIIPEPYAAAKPPTDTAAESEQAAQDADPAPELPAQTSAPSDSDLSNSAQQG